MDQHKSRDKNKEQTMKLTPPKAVTFWISVLLVVAGIAGYATNLGFLTTYAILFVIVGFVLLALGNMIKGL